MRQKKAGIFVLCGLSAFFFFGCEKLAQLTTKSIDVAQPQGTVIAKVNDLPITLEQLTQEIQNYNDSMETAEGKITTREQKISYLNEEMVRRYLLYLEAKSKGLDKQPKTQELLRSLEINVLANKLVQDEIEKITVTSAEIESFYNTYKDQYKQAEERRIREIALDTESEAKDVLIDLLKGTDFASLATQRSRAESASKGGDLGYIKKGQRGADFSRFDEIAFSRSLEVGQISNVFKEKNNYYIIKVEGIKGGQARALSEVWDETKRGIQFLKQQQRIKDITSGLLKKTKVVLYQDLIK